MEFNWRTRRKSGNNNKAGCGFVILSFLNFEPKCQPEEGEIAREWDNLARVLPLLQQVEHHRREAHGLLEWCPFLKALNVVVREPEPDDNYQPPGALSPVENLFSKGEFIWL